MAPNTARTTRHKAWNTTDVFSVMLWEDILLMGYRVPITLKFTMWHMAFILLYRVKTYYMADIIGLYIRGQVVVVKLCCAIIGTHNDLPSVRCQAIIWTNIGFTTWHQYLLYIIHHLAICLMVHLIGITIKYTSYITTVLKVYSLVHIYPFVGSCKWWRNSTPWTIYVL